MSDIGKAKSQTNADRIRNMSDEELLDFICSIETYDEGSVKTIENGVSMHTVTEVRVCIVNCLAEECCGYIGWNEDEAGFYFNVLLEDGTYEEEHIYDYVDCMEIIGNTFDNMELLERSIE